MTNTVYDRLLKREVATDRRRYSSVLGIYGDRKWAQDLDIVNELEGHNGCVNALSWSKSGRLLASGSDDHRINLYSYYPDSSTSQFSLTTSIETGHESNIFSVKFMPYSNDRTIVSATDDVRIFDIEYSGHSALGSGSSSRAQEGRRRVGIHGMPDGVTLTEGDTNAKAFRCHSDTVKRIVTEDSPFYFLTCSEDGDVRQWDIRQPAKAYPPRDYSLPSWATNPDASDNVPPPLISYSRYHLDLNTVSCSPSQPHYIALGGAHLHCFLHDRRMLSRDKLAERGAKLPSPGKWNLDEDELLRKATHCVKKFAPNGQQRMKRSDNGHITACKISDANPNNLIVSWSGDHIYSFDILRSPDATEQGAETKVTTGESSRRVKDRTRKRKRPRSSAALSQEGAERAGSRQRTESSDEGLALRVNYGNGQSEEIRIGSPQRLLSSEETAVVQDTAHFRIAKTTIRLLRRMFDLHDTGSGLKMDDPSAHTAAFTSIIGFAASILPDMDDISRSWRYPMNPTAGDIGFQNKLRWGRAGARRFVQAAGTLARVLGGQLRTGGDANAVISQYFASIEPAPTERVLPRHEQFGYDFLKAILLWLDSGLGAVIQGFSSPGSNARFPIPPDSDTDAIDELLIPYLLHLASDKPIVDVDVSRFESDDTRVLFSSERAAVTAFSQTLKVPFADLTGSDVPTSADVQSLDTLYRRGVAPDFTPMPVQGQDDTQDRKAAIKRWAFQVGRGVLLNAVKDLRFSVIDRAYGGRGIPDAVTRAEEAQFRELQTDIDPLDEDDAVLDAEIVSRAWEEQVAERSGSATSSVVASEMGENGSTGAQAGTDYNMEEEDDDEDEDSDGDIDPIDGEDDEDDEDEDVDSNGLSRTRSGRVLWRSDFDRSYLRERVESHVPCAPHTRVYTGHCNVRTVKDVNFFGQQDEYVVSGSDCGHLFIWDSKTANLVNILEGDGEVVNVVQGHPYEPMMAVSGIDNSIKIFSPSKSDQWNARKGIGVHPADSGNFSSLAFGRRRRPQRTSASTPPPRDPANSEDEDDEVAADGLRSRKALHDLYKITSKNDMDRKGGREDAFITRALLAQLHQRLHAHRHGTGDGDDDAEAPLLLNADEGCNTM
ncbi:WD40 repeat-like protein [Lentithecium fluviatile CBS 122367]|uniref:WD40 repeat-like protein n=1 Tax=Lentithecium fluviatile CBS 122367 TaxID=1168545 RepID=A0A6G1JP91_9PLEO|nr:WD40 repeat-like protein [Lentithecium fluviatile CBS 122367]